MLLLRSVPDSEGGEGGQQEERRLDGDSEVEGNQERKSPEGERPVGLAEGPVVAPARLVGSGQGSDFTDQTQHDHGDNEGSGIGNDQSEGQVGDCV